MGEQDLIAQALAGNRASFESLIEPLIEPAYRLAFAMLRQREAAEDAVQEATLRAWHRLGQLRQRSASLRPWFLTIVANECRSVRRSRWWGVLAIGGLELSWRTTSEDDIASQTDLRRCFRRLSEHDRLLIHLFYWLDLPMDEVATVLGISESAARGRLYRAVGRLRKDLKSTDGDDLP